MLIIVGLGAGSLARELAEVAADGSADEIALKIFDNLTDLPRYSESFEKRGTPSSVEALRTVAAQADVVLIVTTYRGRVPAVVNNAIDWLTRRWDQAALHDKPLAVICGLLQRCLVAPSGGCRWHFGIPSHRLHHGVDPTRGNQEARL